MLTVVSAKRPACRVCGRELERLLISCHDSSDKFYLCECEAVNPVLTLRKLRPAEVERVKREWEELAKNQSLLRRPIMLVS